METSKSVLHTKTTMPLKILGLVVIAGLAISCEQKKQAPPAAAAPATHIFLSSGTVYAGLGIVTSPPSQIISKYSDKGEFIAVLRDFTLSVGDTPVGLLNYDEENIIALIENVGSRRVELIKKDGSGYSTLFTGAALNGVLRAMVYDYSGGLLISESTGIEKYTMNGNRIPIGVSSFVQAPAGACATMTSNLSAIAIGPDQQILIANAFTLASPNNKIAMITKTGYALPGDCVATLAAPTTGHFPTAMLMHSSGRLLIAYANNTGPINQVYSVAVNSATFGPPVMAFSDGSVLQGISKMVELPDGSVLIASAASTFNTIEQFDFDSTSGLLTRRGTQTKILPSIFVRSISDMLVVTKGSTR